jgi:hypothetical protein
VAAYVSPLQYQSFSCEQLREEAARVSARAAIASGAQDQNATNDTIVTTAAVVIFWPAAFFIKGNGANAQEVATLKGDMDAIEQANIAIEQANIAIEQANIAIEQANIAIEQANIEKKCGMQFNRGAAPAAAAATPSG